MKIPPTLYNLLPVDQKWLCCRALMSTSAAAAGIAVSSAADLHIGFYNHAILGATIISGVSGILIRNRAVVILLFFTAGFLSTTWSREEYSRKLSRIEKTAAETGHLRVYGVPDPDISYSYGRYRFLLHSDSIKGIRDNLGKNIKFMCSSRRKPMPDSQVIVEGYYTPPSEPLLPEGYNEYLYSLNRKLYGKISADSTKILSSAEVNSRPGLRLSRLIMETCSEIRSYKVRSILKAVTTGQKRGLPESLSQSFRKAGIYHILALSGLHIAIISGSLLLILSLLPCTQTIKNLIVTLLLWMYLAFIGLIPSLFRAVLMASMILCSVCI
ncbi:MAG: ComEC/Rec2 family competence protein, partial [Chitinivibrionales bacterium]